jgi:hypothetical protein
MIDADVIESTPRGTSGEKAPLGRILRNFRLRIRTPIPPLRVTFGHYGVTFHNVTSGQNAPLRSLPVAMVLVLLYYILYYYYSKKKARGKSGHAQNIIPVRMSLPVRASSGHVTSGNATWAVPYATDVLIRWWWGPLCTRPTCFIVRFFSASSLKQQLTWCLTRTHYSDCEPISLFALSP